MPVAIVTGASGGLGAEFARQLAAEGFDLVLTARSEPVLRELAEECERRFGVRCEVLPADLARAEGRAVLAERTGREDVSVLVNNAGFGSFGRFADSEPQTEAELVAVNVLALHELTRAALTGMTRRGRGRIINIASIAAFQPLPYMAGYGASKAFVLEFSLAVAEELRGTGVSLTTVCPGPTRTGFFDRADAQVFAIGGAADPAEVVRAALSAARRRRPLATPGAGNRLAAFSPRLLPKTAIARMLGAVLPRVKPRQRPEAAGIVPAAAASERGRGSE